MKTILATVIVVIFFVAAIVFSASNTGDVTINYLIAQGSFNVSAVIGFAFITGFVLCWCIFYSLYISLKLKLSATNKKLTQSQKATAQLKEKQLTNV